MSGRLIRMLSTGRAGTKFLAGVFEDQGYVSYHENLYVGEPTSAILQYLYMLADLWKQDKDGYFSFRSNFAEPYVRNVAGLINGEPQSSPRGFWARLQRQRQKRERDGYVIHTAHLMTAATPLIEYEIEKADLESRGLIVFRNPLKTVHAIYLAEDARKPGQQAYRIRPQSLVGEGGFLGAANVWANVYHMALDQFNFFGDKKMQFLELEKFSEDAKYAKRVFDFLGLGFDVDRFLVYVGEQLAKPFRSTKEDSIRNSHLFHDPGFVFSSDQILQIQERIQDITDAYGINWDECVKDYLYFHEHEKAQIGFHTPE
ncbi:MAG: hypothetical protein WEA61_07175 [Anaerolineales bacterium]